MHDKTKSIHVKYHPILWYLIVLQSIWHTLNMIFTDTFSCFNISGFIPSTPHFLLPYCCPYPLFYVFCSYPPPFSILQQVNITFLLSQSFIISSDFSFHLIILFFPRSATAICIPNSDTRMFFSSVCIARWVKIRQYPQGGSYRAS